MKLTVKIVVYQRLHNMKMRTVICDPHEKGLDVSGKTNLADGLISILEKPELGLTLPVNVRKLVSDAVECGDLRAVFFVTCRLDNSEHICHLQWSKQDA